MLQPSVIKRCISSHHHLIRLTKSFRAVSSFSPRIAVAPLAPSPLSASCSAVADSSMDVDELPQQLAFSPTQSIMFPPTIQSRQQPAPAPCVFQFNAPASQVQMLAPNSNQGKDALDSPISPSQRVITSFCSSWLSWSMDYSFSSARVLLHDSLGASALKLWAHGWTRDARKAAQCFFNLTRCFRSVSLSRKQISVIMKNC